MNVWPIFLGGVLLGAVLSLLFCMRAIRYWRKKYRAAIEGRPLEKPETMKRIVYLCVGNGFAWVWCSYVLAAMDKTQTAEELSKVALAEIIVPVAVYAAKSMFENFSKHNKWPDKHAADPPEKPETDDGGDAAG